MGDGPPFVRFMIWIPISSKRFMIFSRASRASSSSAPPFSSMCSGPIAEAPTMKAARAVALWTSPPTPVEFSS